MSNMFYKCSSFSDLNLSNFNTNNVKDMERMFFLMSNGCNLICNNQTILNQFSYS